MSWLKVEKFYVLKDAASLLAQIANEADLKFTPSMFSMIASPSSMFPASRFVATLQLTHQFFANYSLRHPNTHTATISLQSFHDALLDGTTCSSLTIDHLEATSQLALTFQTSDELEGGLPRLQHELKLSPSQREEDLGQIEREKFCTIDSKVFRRIIKEFTFSQLDPIRVIITDSQVKFSYAFKEIILTKEGEQCEIVGHGRGIKTQFHIILHPLSFFFNLTNKGNRISFFKTNDSRGVISVPVHPELYAHYQIYFPQM